MGMSGRRRGCLVAVLVTVIVAGCGLVRAVDAARVRCYEHAAIPLANGRVLIVDGRGARLYDPRADRWVATGAMVTAREAATATPLPDGRVLVVGGSTGGCQRPLLGLPDFRSLATAEIYDPWANRWRVTAPMPTARRYHSATLLDSGRVLVLGGRDEVAYRSPHFPATAEIFDPTTERWHSTAPIDRNTANFAVTPLPDGQALATGRGEGLTNGGSLIARRYLPGTNDWRGIAILDDTRREHTATPLRDGRILLTGGFHYTGEPGFSARTSYPAAAIYDPSADRWSPTGATTFAIGPHTATVLPSGEVLVVGEPDGRGGLGTRAQRFDPATNTWADAGALAAPRDGFVATLLDDGRVLISGGYAGPTFGGSSAYRNATPAAELFDPRTGRWQSAGSMTTARGGHLTTALATGQILATGGFPQSLGGQLHSAEVFDPATGRWRAVGAMSPPWWAFVSWWVPVGVALGLAPVVVWMLLRRRVSGGARPAPPRGARRREPPGGTAAYASPRSLA